MALATRPKPKVQHKKRRAGHHRQSKHYLKTYWPYLPMLLIVGVGLLINSAWSSGGGVLSSKSDFSAQALLEETNERRAADSKSALLLDAQLSAAAQAKADDMVQADYWSHQSPDGSRTPWTFIKASGYQYRQAGENLAYGFATPADAVAGWMSSPSHRDNLLSADYREVGFGVASSPNYQGRGPQTIIVAEYGRPLLTVVGGSPTAAPAAESPPPAEQVAAQTTQPVSRLALLTNAQATWSLAAVSALAGAALMLFITRHGLRLHRALVRGEAFVTHHPYFDIATVLIFMAGFVLTRTGGLIH